MQGRLSRFDLLPSNCTGGIRDEVNRGHFSPRLAVPEDILCRNREKLCPSHPESGILVPDGGISPVIMPGNMPLPVSFGGGTGNRMGFGLWPGGDPGPEGRHDRYTGGPGFYLEET